jgi:hypothetical protein
MLGPNNKGSAGSISKFAKREKRSGKDGTATELRRKPVRVTSGCGAHGQNAREFGFMVDGQPVRVKSQVRTGLLAGGGSQLRTRL